MTLLVIIALLGVIFATAWPAFIALFIAWCLVLAAKAT